MGLESALSVIRFCPSSRGSRRAVEAETVAAVEEEAMDPSEAMPRLSRERPLGPVIEAAAARTQSLLQALVLAVASGCPLRRDKRRR